MAQQAFVTVTVPAGGQFLDVLNGQTLRFVRTPGIVQIGLTQDIAAAIGDVTANITIGGRTVAQGARVPREAAAGSGPLEDRDIRFRDMVKPGDEILVNLFNAGAAAIDVTVYVNLPAQSA